VELSVWKAKDWLETLTIPTGLDSQAQFQACGFRDRNGDSVAGSKLKICFTRFQLIVSG
jgi:hypothetical protein